MVISLIFVVFYTKSYDFCIPDDSKYSVLSNSLYIRYNIGYFFALVEEVEDLDGSSNQNKGNLLHFFVESDKVK
jgi:hypothetical protein